MSSGLDVKRLGCAARGRVDRRRGGQKEFFDIVSSGAVDRITEHQKVEGALAGRIYLRRQQPWVIRELFFTNGVGC